MSQRLYMDYLKQHEQGSYKAQSPPYNSDSAGYRDKNAKMSEIEAYVNVLIENNRTYADETNTLRRENSALRGELQLMMGELIRERQKGAEALASSRAQYTREVGALIEQLKDILSKKEQMEGSYKALLQQLTFQNEAERRARALQLDDLERSHDNKLKVLSERLAEQGRELQQQFYLQSDHKLRMVKEMDSLAYENSELKKACKELKQAQAFAEGEGGRASLALRQVSQEKEQLGVELLRLEQDKNNQVIELKQAAGQLRQQAEEQGACARKLESLLQAKERELLQLADRRDLELRLKNQLESEKLQLAHALNDKASQLADLAADLARLQDFSARELKRMADLIRMLENDTATAARDKDQAQRQLQAHHGELLALLSKLKKLEAEHLTATNTLARVEQENAGLKQLEAVLREDLQDLVLSLRSEQEKGQLQANRMATLEHLLEKEKKKNHLEPHHHQPRHRPAELNNYDDIQELLRRSDLEKGEILQQCQLEKEQLVRVYEKALREKENVFKDKILLMESEIRELGSM